MFARISNDTDHAHNNVRHLSYRRESRQNTRLGINFIKENLHIYSFYIYSVTNYTNPGKHGDGFLLFYA